MRILIRMEIKFRFSYSPFCSTCLIISSKIVFLSYPDEWWFRFFLNVGIMPVLPNFIGSVIHLFCDIFMLTFALSLFIFSSFRMLPSCSVCFLDDIIMRSLVMLLSWTQVVTNTMYSLLWLMAGLFDQGLGLFRWLLWLIFWGLV